jgi:hypothetical protein
MSAAAGKTNKTSAAQDPIAWAVDQGFEPDDVLSLHYVLGYVWSALSTEPGLSKKLADALTLIEANRAMRAQRAGGAK